jgi:exoribonuclease-2
MVGEMMILANHLAAEALNQANLPCPYRFQEKPRARRGAEFEPKNDRQALALDLAARRQLGRGGLTFSPTPHWGLGLSVYTQFTSPIRRYADLLVARQLRSLKNPEAAPYSRVSLMEKAVEADELHRSIRRMQTARERYFLTLLLENKIGGQFTALVFERNDQRTRVCLTEYMVEFDLFKLPSEVRPGRDIYLKLTQANARLQILKFEFLGLA